MKELTSYNRVAAGDWHFCAFCADKANDDTGIYDGAAADVNRYDC